MKIPYFLKKIKSEISNYEDMKIDFRTFLDRIEDLIYNIDDDDLQNTLISMWDKLEIPYALASERGLNEMPHEYVPGILLAIDNINDIADKKIKEYERK